MNKISQFLKTEDQSGFSYIEVLIAMAIFAICITPILSMGFNAAKNSIMGRRYYEATIMAQNLLEEIKNEIGKKTETGNPLGTKGDVENLYDFLNKTQGLFNTDFKGEEYEYEVYIKETNGDSDSYKFKENIDDLYTFVHIDGGSITTLPDTLDRNEVTELSLSNIETKYFGNKFESFLTSRIYDGEKFTIDIDDKYEDNITFDDTNNKIIVDNEPKLGDKDINIELDVSNLEDSIDISIENKTKATVILTLYRFNKANENVEIFPIQQESGGNIFIERKNKVTPKKNYIIRIIVRDRKTSKILKDMIDIYAHDYSIGGGEN